MAGSRIGGQACDGEDAGQPRASANSRGPQQPYSSAFVPSGVGFGSSAAMDFEDRLGAVLTKLKPEDLDALKYHAGAKPVDFEKWAQLTRLTLESRHSQLVDWWDTMYDNAQKAYQVYLALPPLQRSSIRPTNDRFTPVLHQVERYMRRHILRIVPENVQQCLLHMDGVTCADAIFPGDGRRGPGHRE